jgi:hypothetical protein
MSKTMDAQEKGHFEEMTERDREIQASVWALIFLVAEVSLSFRVLRDQLVTKGVFTEADDGLINTLASKEDHVKQAYAHVENAFREKYGRVMHAMANPEEVERQVNATRGAGQTINLQSTATKEEFVSEVEPEILAATKNTHNAGETK